MRFHLGWATGRASDHRTLARGGLGAKGGRSIRGCQSLGKSSAAAPGRNKLVVRPHNKHHATESRRYQRGGSLISIFPPAAIQPPTPVVRQAARKPKSCASLVAMGARAPHPHMNTRARCPHNLACPENSVRRDGTPDFLTNTSDFPEEFHNLQVVGKTEPRTAGGHPLDLLTCTKLKDVIALGLAVAIRCECPAVRSASIRFDNVSRRARSGDELDDCVFGLAADTI